jgi:hypothetical protein
MVVRAAWTLLIFGLSVGLVVSWSLWPGWGTVVIGAILLGAMVMRYRAGLVRRDPSLCSTCGYDLTGLEEAGECPECGEAFLPRWDLEAVLRARANQGIGD